MTVYQFQKTNNSLISSKNIYKHINSQQLKFYLDDSILRAIQLGRFCTFFYIMNRNCRFWPQVLSLRGTVILRIWWQVILMGVYSTGVVFLYKYCKLYNNKELPRDLNIFHMLGITVGLLLVFRTNTGIIMVDQRHQLGYFVFLNSQCR